MHLTKSIKEFAHPDVLYLFQNNDNEVIFGFRKYFISGNINREQVNLVL